MDSQDLSLNISREMLQHNRQLTVIARSIEKKIKSELKAMLENDREKYEEFYSAFGLQLKYGTVSEYGAHKESCQDLLLFYSHKQKKLISLKEYVEAMPEGQEKIYFAPGESKEHLSKLPQVELLSSKDYDTLLFTEEVDEFVPQTLNTYMEKPFCNVTTEDLGLQSEEEKKEAEELYRVFGAALRDLPPKWRVLVLSSHTEFERCFGRTADKKRKLYNGMIKCDAFMYGR